MLAILKSNKRKYFTNYDWKNFHHNCTKTKTKTKYKIKKTAQETISIIKMLSEKKNII